MEIISAVSEYLADLGLDAAKEHFKDNIDEQKLKSALQNYIVGQKKYNEVCSVAEECDFQGLIEYISNSMMEDVKKRFFSVNTNERRKAHEAIVNKAVHYSNAVEDEAKCCVARMIAVSLEIIRNFYRKKISYQEYILSAEIVDAVKENTDRTIEKATTGIMNQLDTIKQSMSDGTLYSLDSILGLAQDGKYLQIESGLKKIMEHISVEHPLYPEYGYAFETGKLKSVPMTEKAIKLYPPHFTFTGVVRAGDKYFTDPSVDPLDYSYRHQIPLVMEVTEAVKLLGNRLDPIQSEVSEIVGNELVANPPAFPPVFPCAVKVGDSTYFDYILLRTQEILDDGTYVVGNREQTDTHIYFEVRINPRVPAKPDFAININDADNHELLNFVKFMYAMKQEGDLHIYVLSARKDFIAGTINNVNYETGFASVEEEIDFLERLCIIEDYFHVHLVVPESISEEEYGCVLKISDLIQNDEVKSTWTEASFTGTLDLHFKEKLETLDTPITMLSYVDTNSVNLFGASFEFQVLRTFKCAKMQDVERIKKIVELSQEGDPIRITFKPENDNSYFDTLKIPESLEEM